MMSKQKMTLKQIAADLSLNPATVSIILNGNKQQRKISPKTEQRVLDYVKKTGYHQDISALSMNGKYSKDIVIVIRSRTTYEQQQVYMRLIGHLESLHLTHTTAFFVEKEGFPLLTKEIEFFNPKKIIVFSVLGHKPAYEQWIELRKSYFSHIPCFFFDSDKDDALLCNNKDAVAQMNRRKMYDEIAASLSSERFKKVMMTLNLSISRIFEDMGFEFVELDFTQSEKFRIPGHAFYIDGLLDAGRNYGRQILEKMHPKGKTAVFLADDHVCCGAIEYLQENGVKVPENIEFFSLGYMAANRIFKYPFTSWAFPYDAMYRKMAQWVKSGIPGDKNKVFAIRKKTVNY